MRDFVLSDDPVVPMLHPRILVELVREAGVPLDDVLRGSGIPQAALASPEARISLTQFGQLIDNALRLTGDPALGLELGRRIQLQNLGMLGLLVMSCGTLRQALDAAIQYQGVFSPALDMRFSEVGHQVVLSCRPTMRLGHHGRFVVETLLSVLHGSTRALLDGGSFEIDEVVVDYPRPQYVDRYELSAVRRFRFGGDRVEIRFDASLLDRRISGGDPITAELARRQCAAQLAPTTRGLLGRIQDHLDGSPGDYPSMDKVARDLRTSPRSLRRYLRGMATSYQALVDEARRRHAEQAVRNTTLTIQQVAELVGYEDVRGFRRAWLRWTGQTPSAYRQALQTPSHGITAQAC